jgi:chromate transporter
MNHDLIHLALLLARLGLLAFGNGNAVLTELQHQAVSSGWMTPQQFRDAYALAQISPGPGPLMVVFVGYILGGIPGGVLAVSAFFFPPALLALFMAGALGRWQQSATLRILRASIVPVTLGLVAALGFTLARGLASPVMILLIGAAAFLSWRFNRLSPGLIILASAAIGGVVMRP